MAHEMAHEREPGMTKAEFLTELDKRDEVRFNGSVIQAPTSAASEALAESLKITLPEDEVIRFGVETSSFAAETWNGKLTWLLVLRSLLLDLTATLTKNAKGDAEIFKVTSQFLPIDGSTEIVVDLEFLAISNANARKAELSVTIQGKKQNVNGPRINALGLCRLASAFVEAREAALR